MYSWEISINDIKEEIKFAIISPNEPNAMIKYIKECKNKNIKTFFDPGQQITTHSKETLLEVMTFSNYLILNDYELNLYANITWLSENEVINSFEKVIVTLWEKWSVIYEKWSKLDIPVVKVENIVDPTGCWDSFRWGLLKWLNIWLNWEISARIWSLSASYCIQKHWTQNHSFTIGEFENEFEKNFWIKLKLN